MLARMLRVSQLLELAACLALAAWWLRGRSDPMVPIAAATAAWFLGVRFLLVCVSSLSGWMHRSIPAPEHRIGAGGVVRMVLAEWRALLAFNLVHLPWERLLLGPEPAARPASHVPVVLVHGYCANRGYFRPLLRRLQARGVGPIFAPNLPPCFTSIERCADVLDVEIERIVAGSGQSRVVLVAHSMGGLMARAYLAHRGASRVARLITIASPHHGTVLARMGWGESARQMRPGSAFLAALERAEGAAGPGVETVSFYSPHDNLVVPQVTSLLPWARNVAMPGFGHIAILDTPAIVALLMPELEAAGVVSRP
jgi:triacylglycerol esterase/lipase EstA (alpha/beta hydrolase family)